MDSTRTCVCLVVCLFIVEVAAFPRGMLHPTEQIYHPEETNDKQEIATLGSLSTVHAVSLAANPSDAVTILYADETAIYKMDKTTGESEIVAGKPAVGLLAMRSAVDGVAHAAEFKFITKIVAREGGLYVFDFNQLRKLDYGSWTVSTLLSLPTSEETPVTGAVSRDEKTAYWTNTVGDGHMVKSMDISAASGQAARLITAGPTLVAHVELSADELSLLLSDVDMGVIESVEISTGDVSFVSQYGQAGFFPGAALAVEDTLYVVNREGLAINRFALTEQKAVQQTLCSEKSSACDSQISNPFALAFDPESNELYILDASYHPTLPVYNFSIKSLKLGEKKVDGENKKHDYNFDKMLEFYSRFFSSLKKKSQ